MCRYEDLKPIGVHLAELLQYIKYKKYKTCDMLARQA
jgi:hypothetical protein